MADYSYVPGRMVSSAVYANGEIALSRTYIGDYRIGYAGSEDHQIRYTFVNDGVSSLSIYLLANSTDLNTSVYLVGPTGTVLETVRTTNFMYSDADNGYQAYITLGFEYNSGEMTTSTTVFDNGYDAGQAMKFEEAPSSESGVVVTALASPIYVPPVTDGVIVNAVARLLDTYAQGGDSGPNTGTGNYNNPDDVIDGPPLPEIGVADGTLIAMFNPNQSELKGLGDYLFDTSIWTAAIKEIFGNPLDYILSLGIVPLKPRITQEKVSFSLGPSPFSNLSMYQITRQFDEVDCGFVRVPEYWGGFLDYEPYTSIQIYLPYIGYREISPSEVLNKDLHVYYHIDLFTGSCICFIQVDDKILYQFEGNCLVQLPLTATAHSQIMSGIISAIGFGATAIATKGLGLFGGAGDFMAWGSGASAIASATNAAKTNVLHGGNISSAYGLLGVQVPYLILRRPRQAVAKEQNHYSGYSAWQRVSDFLFTTGFTKVAEIHLEGLAATDWEIQEIERLLKNGVIF